MIEIFSVTAHNNGFHCRFFQQSMTEHLIDIAAQRKEYTRGRLRRADLTAEPMNLFEQWLKQACVPRRFPMPPL